LREKKKEGAGSRGVSGRERGRFQRWFWLLWFDFKERGAGNNCVFWLRGDGWLVCGNGRKVLAGGRGGLSGWFLVCGEGGSAAVWGKTKPSRRLLFGRDGEWAPPAGLCEEGVRVKVF
jgi:hypothetical protein